MDTAETKGKHSDMLSVCSLCHNVYINIVKHIIFGTSDEGTWRSF